MYDLRNYVLPVKINGVVEMVALVDTGASVSVLPYSLYKDLGLGLLLTWEEVRFVDNGVIYHTYFPKPRTKSYVEAFEMEGEDDWLGSFEVGRDKNGNVKYGLVAPSFIDIEDDMERELAIEAYYNPFRYIEAIKDMGHTRKLMAMEIGMQ
nr:hypothetical protein [Tanacetum cinerariifolium]